MYRCISSKDSITIIGKDPFVQPLYLFAYEMAEQSDYVHKRNDLALNNTELVELKSKCLHQMQQLSLTEAVKSDKL